MAKKFLTSIDLSKCELLNARIHNLAAAPGSPVDGQIYFNTSDGQMYFYDGTIWQSMRGDITSVTLTGGAGASVTQNNSNGGAYTATIDVNVDNTTIGINGSDNLYVIKDAAYLENIYTTDSSFTSNRTATLGASNLTFNATSTGKYTIQNSLYLGQQSAGNGGQLYIYSPADGLSTGITWDDGTAPTGKIKFQHNIGDFVFEIDGVELLQLDGTLGNRGLKINKGVVSSVYALDVTANSGSDVARLEGMLESTSETKFVTISTGGVLKYRTVTGINGSGQVENLGNTNLSVTAGESRTFTINDARTDAFKIADVDGALLNFNTTGASITDKVATFGTSVVIDGNLTVSGSTTTINTETVTIADNIIVLNSNAAGAATESAGFEIERGTDANVQFLWNETNDYWSAVGTKLHVGNIPTGTSDSILIENSGVIEKRALSGLLDELQFFDAISGYATPTAGVITFVGSNGVSVVAAGNIVAVSGVDATTTTKGVASFAAADFDVASGAVSLEDTVVKTVTTDSGALTPSSHGFSILGGEGMDVTHAGTTITVAGEDATTTNKGIVELATSAETNALTDTARAVTPASLAGLRYAGPIPAITGGASGPIAHNLNGSHILFQVFETATGANVEVDIVRIDNNNVRILTCGDHLAGTFQIMAIKIA
jgi:hypothetical protein